MPALKSKQLINDIANGKSTKHSLSKRQLTFVIDRYLYHLTGAIANGYSVASCKKMRFGLSYITFNNIPARLKKYFVYSSKIYGYAFLSSCTSDVMKENDYVFQPSRSFLKRIDEVTSTDVVYSMMQK